MKKRAERITVDLFKNLPEPEDPKKVLEAPDPFTLPISPPFPGWTIIKNIRNMHIKKNIKDINMKINPY
ncbi:hypothetical protein P689_122280 [Candidatus Riesia pediculischaeffi PTSU]|uniref:Uncharacterized protein n=1 Tax=Candidatus Riesia pediculischaeffi PTSU TaxID=1401651 RepID=A0A0C1V7K8_9ENTR|nr:hypothetical protein P689_122280 [Candidatus Riesia pediculischaeffi PTSU]